MAQHPFRPALFGFLRDLAENNTRDWFQANKSRYEDDVRGPAMEFISECAPLLEKISPHFSADPRPSGGSLFRIHRDVRFSKDKSPYKTHTGIHLRHVRAKDVHAPGYYLHLEPRNVFLGVGIWHPETQAARQIREAIVHDSKAWKKAVGTKRFRDTFELQGDSLKRPPAGFDKEHPLIDDLRRKDFIAVTALKQSQVTAQDFPQQFMSLCAQGSPFMSFLCSSLELQF